MMNPITIDLTEVIEGVSMSESEIEDFSAAISSKIENSFKVNWEKLVNSELNSTRREYKQGMYTERPDANTFIVGLTSSQSEMAMDIEEGKSAFDMKEGFERSAKKTMTKDGGWYLTIPMRAATPEAVATSTIFANKMTKDVYKIAKKLGQGEQIKRQNLPKINQKLGQRDAINSGGKKFAAYEHKSPIFAGIQKGQGEHHGQYNSFRRVGSNSDKDSWIHKGFTAKNLMDRAWDNMDIESIVAFGKDDFLGI